MNHLVRSMPRRVAVHLAGHGWRYSDIARLFGVSRQRVQQWLGIRNHHIPKSQRRMMARVAVHLRGSPYHWGIPLIADIFRVKRHTISNILSLAR